MTLEDAYGLAALAAPLGSTGLFLAVAFRRGRFRKLANGYWDATYPWYIRNAVFMMAPGGIAFLLSVPAGFLFATGRLLEGSIGLLLSCGFIVGFWIAVNWARRPPDFMKPDWLRAEELRRGPQPAAIGAARWIDRGTWLFAIAIVSIALVGIPILILFGST
jgi:hypothetical protein